MLPSRRIDFFPKGNNFQGARHLYDLFHIKSSIFTRISASQFSKMSSPLPRVAMRAPEIVRARNAELKFQRVRKFQSHRPGFTYMLIPYPDHS